MDHLTDPQQGIIRMIQRIPQLDTSSMTPASSHEFATIIKFKCLQVPHVHDIEMMLRKALMQELSRALSWHGGGLMAKDVLSALPSCKVFYSTLGTKL